jgi:hypothetical protein
MEPGPGSQYERLINCRAQSLLAHSITSNIYLVPAPFGISGNAEVIRRVTLGQRFSGDNVIDKPYIATSK